MVCREQDRPIAEDVGRFIGIEGTAKLLSRDADGFTCVSILDYIHQGGNYFFCLSRKDPTVVNLLENPQATFLVDRIIDERERDQVNPIEGGLTSRAYQAVLMHGEATVIRSVEAVSDFIESFSVLHPTLGLLQGLRSHEGLFSHYVSRLVLVHFQPITIQAKLLP